MKRSFGKLFLAPLVALVLASFAMAPYADAAAARGGGGGDRGAGGGGGGGRATGGGGGARAPGAGGGGGGGKQSAQVNDSKADTRTNNVRSSSANNVNVERNVDVNVEGGGWDNDYHPGATAAAVTAGVAVTSAVVGSRVRSVPPSCVPVNYAGVVYQQCGSTWYQAQGSQYVVVNPPY
jgi:hypothetical protein